MLDSINKAIEQLKNVNIWDSVKKVSERKIIFLTLMKIHQKSGTDKNSIGKTESDLGQMRLNRRFRSILQKRRMTF